MDYTLNCNGRLLSLSEPRVMGIVNVTPDSFFADSRQQTDDAVARRVEQVLAEGAAIVDVGACSTRPGGQPVSEDEEWKRLSMALTTVRRVAPESVVSIDTYRPQVARRAVEEYGADIINDVGGPLTGDPTERSDDMLRMVARLGVPYIYMSRKATVRDILLDFAQTVDTLRTMGQKDIVLDPGFGFGKTLQQNYQVLAQMERMAMAGLPLLVGLSRKSMIHRLLDTDPQGALNGTTALHAIALLKGASILRVHDVREAVETVRLVQAMANPAQPDPDRKGNNNESK
ncbi:MAG: dihydropteroate synthase [Prevotella sp.]|nr:dihydropteroate synthase [Prevotella sp.]